MKLSPSLSAVSSLLAGLVGTLAAHLNAQIVMQYTGDPATTAGGTLATAHHVEARVEFANVGDVSPTAVDARLVTGSGDTLLHIQSSGPIGTPLWTATFLWDAGQITDWYFLVSSTGIYPEDRISSINYPHGTPPQTPEDQAVDEFTGGGFDGIAQAFTAGRWTPIPEPHGIALAAALGLAGFGAIRRQPVCRKTVRLN